MNKSILGIKIVGNDSTHPSTRSLVRMNHHMIINNHMTGNQYLADMIHLRCVGEK